MRTLILCLTLLCFRETSFSQTAENNAGFMEGYIVKLNNDTLIGEVKFWEENDRMLSNIRYRENANASIRSFGSHEIKAFALGRYDYRVYDGKFLQQTGHGPKVDIYESRNHTYNINFTAPSPGLYVTRNDEELSKIYLIKKDGSRLTYVNTSKLINKKLKSKLTDFFKDVPSLVEKIRKSYYTHEDIIYMAYEYNEPERYQLKVIDKKQYKKEKAERK